MKSHRMVAIAVASALALGAAQAALLAAGPASIAGTAKDEAAKPYTDYSVRARDVKEGQVGGSITLDSRGNFYLGELPSAKYVVELVNKGGKVICTKGPYDLTKDATKNNVVVDCDRIPAAEWLLGAGAAAGVTAAVVAPAPAPDAAPAVATFAVAPPASPSR